VKQTHVCDDWVELKKDAVEKAAVKPAAVKPQERVIAVTKKLCKGCLHRVKSYCKVKKTWTRADDSCDKWEDLNPINIIQLSAAERKKALNAAAHTILDVMGDVKKADFVTVAEETGLPLGFYIASLLNFIYHQPSLYAYLAEDAWTSEVESIPDEPLYCEFCKKLIKKPDYIKQRFCSNLCAKRFKDAIAKTETKTAKEVL